MFYSRLLVVVIVEVSLRSRPVKQTYLCILDIHNQNNNTPTDLMDSTR